MRSALALLACYVSAAAQVITTVAGTTFTFPRLPLPALNAPIGFPYGVATDFKGNLYISDFAVSIVTRVAPDGTLSVVAGNGTYGFSGDDGPATSAALHSPVGLAIDAIGMKAAGKTTPRCGRDTIQISHLRAAGLTSASVWAV